MTWINPIYPQLYSKKQIKASQWQKHWTSLKQSNFATINCKAKDNSVQLLQAQLLAVNTKKGEGWDVCTFLQIKGFIGHKSELLAKRKPPISFQFIELYFSLNWQKRRDTL